MKVLVLFGGVSTEHLVSCRSARNIIAGLREAGHEPLAVGITEGGEWLRFLAPDEDIDAPDWEARARAALAVAAPQPAPPVSGNSVRDFIVQLAGSEPDLVFPIVHGINGEDGSLQGLLQLADLPFVGSGVLASAAAMDKVTTKRLAEAAGIRTARYTVVQRDELEAEGAGQVARRLAAGFGLPLFVKPSNGGSSVGTMGAATEAELAEALAFAAGYDRTILVEEHVNAREIEVAVLGNGPWEAARAGEILLNEEVAYYDYEAKYFSTSAVAEAVVPTDLAPETEAEIRRLAVETCRTLGIAGLSRVDFFLEHGTGRILLNEVNNLPGFTAISLYPMAFAAAGLPLAALCNRLCELALADYQGRRRRSSHQRRGE
ncbi:MAG: D-alanine--D-alanine ligase family protein [Bacillota bacterium]|nr:D-alanine--D-alanine ligase family protein [Bacillota bacterium]